MRQVAAILCILLAAGCEPAQRDVQMFAADAPPGLLSEWGVFSITGDGLDVNERVTPYELKTPLFSDYALKLRTVWMPEGRSARYAPTAEFDFPVGTIISKTFHYRKAADWAADNARVLVEEQGGPNHVGFPYVWNRAQTDAVLEIAGDVRTIQLSHGEDTADLNYVVPDVNQCAGCHTPNHSDGELRPLGPKAWQLNRSYDWWSEGGSQVNHWRSQGLLLEAPQLVPDETSDLDRAAREYLDANCAHCHNPAGAADTSALHLNIDAPVDRKLGVCKTPVAVGRGSGDLNYDIYPGRPDDSIMIFRMQHSDPAIAMPELGRSAIHVEGVRLVSEWIAAMSGEC